MGGFLRSYLSYLFDYAKLYLNAGEEKQIKMPELKKYYANTDILKKIPSNENIEKELKNCENAFFKACKDYTQDIHLQEVTFRTVKGHLLPCKPSPFTR